LFSSQQNQETSQEQSTQAAVPGQGQPMPGRSKDMDPEPNYGEDTYTGSGRLSGKKAVITGADSGIGRAVALAFGREGADVVAPSSSGQPWSLAE
jgi:hypothetical protein